MTTMATLFKHESHHSSALNSLLWLGQGILALIFGMTGYMKLAKPMDELILAMPWTLDVSESLVRFIGAAELTGAIGIVLPALLKVLPRLSTLAAFGLAVIMLLATGFHLLLGEIGMMPLPMLLGTIAAFVAWGREYREPIQ